MHSYGIDSYVRRESRVFRSGNRGLGIVDIEVGKGLAGAVVATRMAITITVRSTYSTIREQDYGTDKRAACIDEPHHSTISTI
jgi:hypothetical protein